MLHINCAFINSVNVTRWNGRFDNLKNAPHLSFHFYRRLSINNDKNYFSSVIFNHPVAVTFLFQTLICIDKPTNKQTNKQTRKDRKFLKMHWSDFHLSSLGGIVVSLPVIPVDTELTWTRESPRVNSVSLANHLPKEGWPCSAWRSRGSSFECTNAWTANSQIKIYSSGGFFSRKKSNYFEDRDPNWKRDISLWTFSFRIIRKHVLTFCVFV